VADYSEFVLLAHELLTEEGKLVTLQTLGTNTSDLSKPWKGTTEQDVVMEYRSVPCAFIAPIGKDLGIIVQDKDLLKRSTKVAICAAVAEGLEDKITRIKDIDGTIWKVIWSQTLCPAEQTIIYIFGIAR
jgi:hypothetical protein